ncbi:non-ribosomal peptide synthetase [Amycolatopsis jiangsuensis]|uniref:Amino acid adenylation domain-containing protein n=1 Tax=Amycolatopsis jiangsuensis TaxID=1181879 RepID=A0A840J5B9_9PSEU|nr:non-ribosomal peptide synthetase [Amycolatopsis jiangsuensis]MBB4689230.1 amino acid adenylation domain-containing protein [Amycolatopsis jiangsuensis]
MAQASFQRPVSPTEWWFLGHPPELSAAVQIVVEGAGELTVARLGEAVAVASAACPGSRLVRDGRQWADSGMAPPVREAGHAELLAPLSGSTCEVLVVEGDPRSIVFRADHAVMDAKGVLTWAADVFRVLRGEDPLGAPDPVSDKEVFDGLPETDDLAIPEYACAPVLGALEPTDHSRAVTGRRSVQGTHPGLAAKLATVLVSAAGRESGVFHIPVDLRHLAPGTRSTANLSTGFTLEVRADEDAESVHSRLLAELAAGAAVRKAPPASLLEMPLEQLNEVLTTIDRRARERDAFPSHASLSHAGRVGADTWHSPGFTGRTAYLMSRPNPGGAPDFNILEVGDRTEITLSWWDGPDTADRIEGLLDRVVEGLSPDRHWPGNETAVVQDVQTDVVTRVLRQAELTPDAIAVSGPDGDLGYREFTHRAEVIAAALRDRGVGQETLVGVVGDRSSAAVTALWGVLRAGAAYLPIDAHHPDGRIRAVLEDSGAPVCLVERSRDHGFAPPGCATVVIEDLDYTADPDVPEPAPADDQLAYVIYTSGSTGKPKGVEIDHGALRNYAHWAVREFALDATTRAPLLVSLGFDLAGNTLFPPLLAGGAIVTCPGEISNELLERLLTTSGATTLSLTPSHLALINRLGVTASGFRTLVVIGEQLTTAVARRAQEVFGPECVVINSYGPTEATVMMTVHRFDAVTDTDAAVPIGVPVDNNTVVLLDPHGRPSRSGELLIGGRQLARRYRGRPDLTAERFVTLADGRRYYRTGDLARILPSGELEFLARTDDQVKVLGHRIEPAEIVAALETHPAVRQAVVVPRASGEQKVLCAYVVGDPVGTDTVLAHLADRLPRYMLPAATVFVDDIPRTLNGKADPSALPNPFPGTTEAVTHHPLTARVAGIWAGLLGIPAERIAPTADFHELGGNSLLFLAMLAALTRDLLGETRHDLITAELPRLVRDPTLDAVTAVAKDLLAAPPVDGLPETSGPRQEHAVPG